MTEELAIANKYCTEAEALEGQRILAENGIESEITGSTIFTQNFIENTYKGINLLVREEDLAAAQAALAPKEAEEQSEFKINVLTICGILLFVTGFTLLFSDLQLENYGHYGILTSIVGIFVFFKGIVSE